MMIEFKQVSKRYANGTQALHEIDLSLGQAEFAFLTGHSGAGKSSLLKLIAGIERPSAGQIVLNDKLLNRVPTKKLPFIRRSMGLIQQNPSLLRERPVFDNVALPLHVAGFKQRDIAKRVRAALDKVNLLHKERVYPDELSLGEQQRIGIARAVVHKPSLLIADEPTGNLDPELSRDIVKLFEQFNQVGVTVLIATHDIDLINSVSTTKRIHLHGGRIVEAAS